MTEFTKSCIVWGLAAALSVVLIFVLYPDDTVEKHIRENNIAACRFLNPKYGEIFYTRSGFYENIPLIATAITYSQQTIRVKTLEGEELVFYCRDLKRSEEK